MSYKTTLLKEQKQIIDEVRTEIIGLIKTNENILNFENLNEWDLKIVENNLKLIEEKESLIKQYKQNIQEILKMNNAA